MTHANTVEINGSNVDKELVLSTYQRFIKLSSYLFKRSESTIYNVNEIPEDSEFYSDAKKTARQLKINWKSMSHANSNRIMLALLEDYFQAMQNIEKSNQNVSKQKFAPLHLQVIKNNKSRQFYQQIHIKWVKNKKLNHEVMCELDAPVRWSSYDFIC